ncbi:hypothetical protein NIASO_12105 [Niabella soli DSM 19437]|uniref:Uncharacterized protein n=1 Tax=Niabella soli DSM 19437 TaxID=929713 RepID=W0F8A9_9BACT|nr:hypothetical protein NIASO_12105 [Niabella soli DSM 19437]
MGARLSIFTGENKKTGEDTVLPRPDLFEKNVKC